MNKRRNNYAFIDSQNVNLGVRSLGWNLDWKKFRVYLKDKYKISKAYLFIGFLEKNKNLYDFLSQSGFELVFKPVIPDDKGEPKGNIDANLVLQAMVEFDDYDKAMIISSDGDFYCLVDYLSERDKIIAVMSSHIDTCSVLLKKSAKEKIFFMNNLKNKLEYIKRKGTA